MPLPPLPLPATPLRRSEQKHPPAPTTLIGKVIWGGYLDYTWPNGVVSRVFDWNMVPADAQQLLRHLKGRSGLEYQAVTLDLGMLSGDPAEVPVLLFSGGRSISFTPGERARLRKYLLDGGMVWFDSVAGSPFFSRSAAGEMRKILPEAPLRRVPADHPVFHLAKSLVAGETNRSKAQPFELEGVFLGPRLAAVISPVGLGCGWDNARPELIADARYYKPAAAVDLGVNLALYAVGWFDSARRYAAGESEAEPGTANPEQVPFAQLVTDGFWNSDPGSGDRFLRWKNCAATSTTAASCWSTIRWGWRNSTGRRAGSSRGSTRKRSSDAFRRTTCCSLTGRTSSPIPVSRRRRRRVIPAKHFRCCTASPTATGWRWSIRRSTLRGAGSRCRVPAV